MHNYDIELLSVRIVQGMAGGFLGRWSIGFARAGRWPAGSELAEGRQSGEMQLVARFLRPV